MVKNCSKTYGEKFVKESKLLKKYFKENCINFHVDGSKENQADIDIIKMWF